MAMQVLMRAKQMGRAVMGGAVDLLYPPVCPICEKSLEREEGAQLRFVCGSCFSAIRPIEQQECARCGDPLPEAAIDLCERCASEPVRFEWARSVGIYDGVLARLIQRLKYEKERALAQDLAQLLADYLRNKNLLDKFDCITFVPMSPKSLRLRGFNSAELLARKTGKRVQKPVIAALRKTRETRPQMELSGEERKRNLQNAFAPKLQGAAKSILLIDDVYTTGTTVRECSQILIENGWERVAVLTLARTPIERDHVNED